MTVNGLYKAELIHCHHTWPTVTAVEIATLDWVNWWNTKRLHGSALAAALLEMACLQRLPRKDQRSGAWESRVDHLQQLVTSHSVREGDVTAPTDHLLRARRTSG